jgi:hypothetical protein
MGTDWGAKYLALLAERKGMLIWLWVFAIGFLGGILGTLLIGGMRAEIIEKDRIESESRLRKMEGRKYFVFEYGNLATRHERSDCPALYKEIEAWVNKVRPPKKGEGTDLDHIGDLVDYQSNSTKYCLILTYKGGRCVDAKGFFCDGTTACPRCCE